MAGCIDNHSSDIYRNPFRIMETTCAALPGGAKMYTIAVHMRAIVL